MNENLTQQRVVADYFRTTSGGGVSASESGFAFSVAGLRRRLKPWLDVEGKAVLDLGSGHGVLCRIAEDARAASVVGVNLSAEEIAYARTKSRATFEHQDIAKYLSQCPPASVDRVFALNILEHLDKDSLVQVLEGVFRALCDEGRLIIMVPNATSPFGGMTRYWDITHHNAFTPSSLKQLARLVGFDAELDFRECGPVPHGLVSGARFVLWQFIRLGIYSYLMVETASSKGGIYTADMLVRFTKRARSA
jgi:SAM-dependent methyltransferase